MSGEVVARGGTLPQAFIEAVLGLFALAVDPAAVDPREARETRAHGASLEALLAHWIGECCYVHEMEGFVCHRIDFAVNDAEGNRVRLKDLRGKKVVLYFYPKDDTPGCTKEACAFRDSFAQFKKRGIEVLGVSLDNEKSHQKFIKKYDLPFRLLADTERAISEGYGTYGEKKFMGRTYMGNHRMTFLIDEKGKIKKIFSKVKPEEHAAEVLDVFGK